LSLAQQAVATISSMDAAARIENFGMAGTSGDLL
jgi:hypothetical protein